MPDHNQEHRSKFVSRRTCPHVRIMELEAENEALRHLVQLAKDRAENYLGNDWHIAYLELLEN